MSFEETPSTVQEILIYIKGVSWKDTFHVVKYPICIKGVKRHLLQFDKFECLMNLILKLKMFLEEIHFTIPKNFNLYKSVTNPCVTMHNYQKHHYTHK